MKKILALDIGTKRVGVAVSDEQQRYAFPRTTLPGDDMPTLQTELGRILDDDDVECIVVGMPYSLKQSAANTAMAKKVREVLTTLRTNISIPIIEEDERFTTRIAERLLRDAQKSARQKKATRDQIAAATLLQTYLDRQHN